MQNNYNDDNDTDADDVDDSSNYTHEFRFNFVVLYSHALTCKTIEWKVVDWIKLATDRGQ